MKRVRRSCTLLIVAIVLPACATFPELPKSLPGYVAPVAGDEYNYRNSASKYFWRIVLEVNGAVTTERNLGTDTVIMRWADLVYLRDGNTEYRHETDFSDFFPLTVGKTLAVRSVVNGRAYPGTEKLSVLRKERVRVLAGEFDAFVISYCWERVGRSSGCALRWYVPELGRWVRLEETVSDRNGTRTFWEELVSLPPRLTTKDIAPKQSP